MKNLRMNHKSKFDHYGSIGERIYQKKQLLTKLNSSVISPKNIYEPMFPDLNNNEQTDSHYHSFL